MLTKEEFYRLRGETYPMEDPEALIRYRRAIDWMEIKRGVVVREVGCKFSVIRDFLNARSDAVDYAAIDIDESTLRKIAEYSPQAFIRHNANHGLPFDDGGADYVVCLEVLEHLENATAFFAEARRVLRPGGHMILSVPNPYCWMEFVDNFRRAADQEGHITTYTHQNIDALSRFCGFELLGMKGTFTRVPFSARLFGAPKRIVTDNIFLTRSYMFLLRKPLTGQ